MQFCQELIPVFRGSSCLHSISAGTLVISRGVGESPGFYERNDDGDDVAALAFGRRKTQLRMQLYGRICNRDCTENRMGTEGTNVARHIPVHRHHRSFKFVEGNALASFREKFAARGETPIRAVNYAREDTLIVSARVD